MTAAEREFWALVRAADELVRGVPGAATEQEIKGWFARLCFAGNRDAVSLRQALDATPMAPNPLWEDGTVVHLHAAGTNHPPGTHYAGLWRDKNMKWHVSPQWHFLGRRQP